MRGQKSPADLLVGLDVTDDAAVYLVARDLAIVETLDFFPPIVDDAYASGAIGAANAMSDVYAMGGEVLFALNIAAWPEDAPLSQLQRIFQGAIEKVAGRWGRGRWPHRDRSGAEVRPRRHRPRAPGAAAPEVAAPG